MNTPARSGLPCTALHCPQRLANLAIRIRRSSVHSSRQGTSAEAEQAKPLLRVARYRVHVALARRNSMDGCCPSKPALVVTYRQLALLIVTGVLTGGARRWEKVADCGRCCAESLVSQSLRKRR